MILAGLHRILILASLIVPAGLFAAAAVQNRADVMREGEQELIRSAAVMDEHARKVFETGELVLAYVDDHVSEMSWEQIAAPETSAFLARLRQSLEHVVSIWITDASGTVRAGSQPWNPAIGIGDREFFRAQRERDRGAYLSAAFRGKATDTASFAISRRRSAAGGRFDGTIHIALSPEYFARTYQTVVAEPDHAAILVRSDGEVLVRDPYATVNAPLTPARSPLMRRIEAQPEGGFGTGNSSVNGTQLAFAYRKVGGYPAYVGVGVPVAVLLQRWYENLELYGAAASVASLMLLLASWQAVRGQRAERATLARLHRALEQLQRETAQRETAEQRMRQAEKMEAVGKLTGGIAHDFNNLLTAVLAACSCCASACRRRRRAARLLDNALQGAERGAALTQRLLAFGRRQVLNPARWNCRRWCAGMSRCCAARSVAGSTCVDRFPPGLPPARADANQLELAVLNLARMPATRCRAAARSRSRRGRAGRRRRGAGLGAGPLRGAQRHRCRRGHGRGDARPARWSRSSRPRGSARAPVSACRWCTGWRRSPAGRFLLRSRAGDGTVAEIWLPEAEPATVPAGAPARGGVVRRRPRRGTVLLVDDDPLVLATPRRCWRISAIEVVTARPAPRRWRLSGRRPRSTW